MKKKKKGMNVPDDLKYKENHHWIRMIDDITGLCGITDFAQNNLGEIVFVEFINNILNSEIGDDEIARKRASRATVQDEAAQKPFRRGMGPHVVGERYAERSDEAKAIYP